MKIGVVMIGVTNGAAANEFYRDCVGLKVINEHEGFTFLDTGSSTLVLSTALASALGSPPGNIEVVFSVEHVRAEHERLRGRGVEFLGEPRLTTGIMWSANFKDPAGHLLSIFGPE